MYQPIGIFDSGYGGLTVFKAISEKLPQYDFLYLGDNARAPYGSRSFETVYEYTLQGVKYLFEQGCRLVILACNTASAKALRTIQQKDLPAINAGRRVLGVIRPTTEVVGKYTKTGNVGIMATSGTVNSLSYPIEINHFYPEIKVFQQACPLWAPLIENNEYDNAGTDFFIKKYLDELFEKSADVDVIILGCTHYPLLIDKIKKYLPSKCTLLDQGKIVAHSLADYLDRHPEMEKQCSKNGKRDFLTTDSARLFDHHATIFRGSTVHSRQVSL